MFNGLLAGALGGLVGTWAMSEVQRLWTRAVDDDVPESAGGKHDARDSQERVEGQNANELAAQAIAHLLIRRPLERAELQIAAPLMHYGFGSIVGALYGSFVERRRHVDVLSGAAFGTAVWLTADELAMPLLMLSQPTTRRPLEMHLQSLAAHVVYGVTAEIARHVAVSHLSSSVSNEL